MSHRSLSFAALLLAALVTVSLAGHDVDADWSPDTSLPSAASFEVFFNDEDESPGSIYRYLPATGAVDTVYTRASGRIGSFSTYFYPHKLYYVSGSNAEIYRVNYVTGKWQAEQVIFTHQTYVRDIAFLPDSGGTPELYFSQASGGGADGWIFKEAYGKAVQVYRVRLSEVGGYWAGDFAFDEQGRLYLSTGNRTPSRMYRVDSGTPVQIYAPKSGMIGGFFGLPSVAYYADNDETIYRVDVAAGSRSTVHASSAHTRITDVQTVGDEPATATPPPTPTRTPSPTPSPTSVATETATHTVVPTSTATPTATTVPQGTATATHTGVPSAVATDTPTTVPTSTATPTATTVASAVPSVTATLSNMGWLAGVVILDGRGDHGGVSFDVDGPLSGWTSGADGSYTLGPLDPGPHTVDVSYAGHLRTGSRTFTVVAGQTLQLPTATLLGGDTNADDRIDIVDGAIVSGSFGLSIGDGAYDPRADVNGDDAVDIFDLVTVGSNFGCQVSDEVARCRLWAEP